MLCSSISSNSPPFHPSLVFSSPPLPNSPLNTELKRKEPSHPKKKGQHPRTLTSHLYSYTQNKKKATTIWRLWALKMWPFLWFISWLAHYLFFVFCLTTYKSHFQQLPYSQGLATAGSTAYLICQFFIWFYLTGLSWCNLGGFVPLKFYYWVNKSLLGNFRSYWEHLHYLQTFTI